MPPKRRRSYSRKSYSYKRTRFNRSGPSRSHTTNRTNRVGTTSAVTFQRDQGRVFKKKYVPRWKVKRAQRFYKRVTDVVKRNLGQKTIKRESNILYIAGGASAQMVSSFAINGSYGHGDQGWNDLHQIATTVQSDPITNTWDQEKLSYSSAVIDVLITNDSENMPIVLDVYRLIPKKDMATSDAASVAQKWTNAMSNQTILGTALAISAIQVGVTPFDGTELCAMWTIVEKKTFYLQTGHQTTFQFRDTKRRTITGSNLYQKTALRGVTTGWIVVGKPTYSDAVSRGIVRYSVQTIRKYNFHVFEDNEGGAGHVL